MEGFMNIECKRPNISEYDFLRLLVSTMIIQKQSTIIENHKLEKDLYDFYSNPDFHFLFEDVCKKDSIDNKYVDLNVAFQTAYAFGLLTMIKDSSDIRSIINLSEKEAIETNSQYKLNEVEAMNELCKKLNGAEQLDKPLVLSKKKNKCMNA